MTNAGRPDDDLATLRHCSGSLTCHAASRTFSSRLPEPSAWLSATRGHVSVSSWWSYPALLNILCPQILLPPLLFCCFSARASWFQHFERQKSVGDDTWQLMPDWTRSVPRPALWRRTSPHSYRKRSLAHPMYCPLTMTNRTVRYEHTLSLGSVSNFGSMSWPASGAPEFTRIFETAVSGQ
jgi:hypothetical protein